MSSSMVSTLNKIIALAQEGLQGVSHSSGSNSKNTKNKTPSSRKGLPTADGDFTKMILNTQSKAYEDFKNQQKETNPDQKGLHYIFISQYKKDHPDEYTKFKASWVDSHAKSDDSQSVTSDVGSTNDAVSSEPVSSEPASSEPASSEPVSSELVSSESATNKPKRIVSDEQKAKAKATRERTAMEKKKIASKITSVESTPVESTPVESTPVEVTPVVKSTPAKKQVKQVKKVKQEPEVIPTPVIAEDASDSEEHEPLAFKMNNKNYIRIGIRRANGNHLWYSGDLWVSKNGAMGDYVGFLRDDGTIDTNAEEPKIDEE